MHNFSLKMYRQPSVRPPNDVLS